MKDAITLEEMKSHIDIYFMLHIDSNNVPKSTTTRAFTLDDIEWLFDNIQRLREVYPLECVDCGMQITPTNKLIGKNCEWCVKRYIESINKKN